MIQGSKLSGFLYNLYTNKVPIVHKIMKDPAKYGITNEVKIDNEDINHYVHNFVDDSNSIISGRKEEDIKSYTIKYMKLMKIYYSTNILKMNQLKTNIMIIPKQNSKTEWKKETFQVDGNQLKTNKTIKILGNIMNPQLNNEAEINNLIKSLEYRTTMIRRIKNFTTMITRKKIANAVIIGKLNYMMPTYTNLTEIQRQKIHVILMKAAKATIGLPCYRWTNQRILETVGWIPLKAMID